MLQPNDEQKQILDRFEAIQADRIKEIMESEITSDEPASTSLETALVATREQARAARIPEHLVHQAGQRAVLRTLTNPSPETAKRRTLTPEEMKTFRPYFLTHTFYEGSKNADGTPGPSTSRAEANMNREWASLRAAGQTPENIMDALEILTRMRAKRDAQAAGR